MWILNWLRGKDVDEEVKTNYHIDLLSMKKDENRCHYADPHNSKITRINHRKWISANSVAISDTMGHVIYTVIGSEEEAIFAYFLGISLMPITGVTLHYHSACVVTCSLPDETILALKVIYNFVVDGIGLDDRISRCCGLLMPFKHALYLSPRCIGFFPNFKNKIENMVGPAFSLQMMPEIVESILGDKKLNFDVTSIVKSYFPRIKKFCMLFPGRRNGGIRHYEMINLLLTSRRSLDDILLEYFSDKVSIGWGHLSTNFCRSGWKRNRETSFIYLTNDSLRGEWRNGDSCVYSILDKVGHKKLSMYHYHGRNDLWEQSARVYGWSVKALEYINGLVNSPLKISSECQAVITSETVMKSSSESVLSEGSSEY